MSVQRVSDIGLAVVLLAICLPVLVLTCLILAAEHAQFPVQRLEHRTRSGKRIGLFRLRVAQSTPFGLRLTRSGALVHRLHLDQVPMLLNVLAGDLTLAGADHAGLVTPHILIERHLTRS